MSKTKVRTSKFLSLILRHAPETVGLTLDDNGWVEVDVLLQAVKVHGTPISRELLEDVVFSNDKQRFAFSPDASRIRANQGHSLNVELGLSPVPPPSVLYHGTATRFLQGIRSEGLQKMSRQHVHLSSSRGQALRVGSRHGKPVVLEVDCDSMSRDGFHFLLSANGVWLTEAVAVGYIKWQE